MDINKEFQKHVKDFKQSDKFSDQDLILNYCLGLSGEAGEVIDLIKKNIFHGDTLDKGKLAKELGDLLWYCFALCDSYEFSVDYIMQLNINKLRERHKGKVFNQKQQRISKNEEKEIDDF